MTLEEAVRLVVETTGDNPIHAFELDGVQYVYATPLPHYNADEDVEACYYPVKDGAVGAPMNYFNLSMSVDDPMRLFVAMASAQSFLRESSK